MIVAPHAHLNSGQSVIVIRFIRQYKGGVEKAVRDTFELLEEQNSIDNLGLAVEFPSGKNATYFILPAADHKDVLYHAIDTLADSRIGSLFKRHTDYIR